jgi:DNA processing protein
MDRDELLGWFALKAVPGVGDVLYKHLIERWGSPRAVFSASESELLSVEGMKAQIAQAILQAGTGTKRIEKELDRLDEQGVEIVTITNPDYPYLLKQIHDPPPILYLKGTLRPEDRRAIAIVGSRNASGYGRRVALKISEELAGQGFTIVSGLARGIDAAAHEGALSASGRTIGVLGCGVDITYPPEHHDLQENVSMRGAVLSEFPLGTEPLPERFPRRNRVISGLSLGVIVVEAAERSGALITATCALEQGREVFAVPGPVGSATTVGTHRLIKQGAKLVEGVEDILEEISTQLRVAPDPSRAQIKAHVDSSPSVRGKSDHPSRPLGLDPEELKIFELLSDEPQHIDDLTVQAKRPPSEMAGLLLQLELKGAARQLAGHLYVRTDPV